MHRDILQTHTLLQQWGDFARQQGILHNKSRIYYKLLDFGMMIPSLIFASVSGVSMISVSNNEKCNTDTSWFIVAMGVSSLISSALVAIHRYTCVADLQRRHDTYADSFTSFANEIDMQLSIGLDEQGKVFTNIYELIKFTKRNLDLMIDKAPGLPFYLSVNRQSPNSIQHLQ
jgi:hypothetical protein